MGAASTMRVRQRSPSACLRPWVSINLRLSSRCNHSFLIFRDSARQEGDLPLAQVLSTLSHLWPHHGAGSCSTCASRKSLKCTFAHRLESSCWSSRSSAPSLSTPCPPRCSRSRPRISPHPPTTASDSPSKVKPTKSAFFPLASTLSVRSM